MTDITQTRRAWLKDKVATTDSGVTIKSIREDVPRFKREYTAVLDDGRSIMVTIYNLFKGHRTNRGELIQRNGNRVWFDPEHIADKIIDPVLVPKVTARVKEIFQLDRNFMNNQPGEYVDETGATWQRR